MKGISLGKVITSFDAFSPKMDLIELNIIIPLTHNYWFQTKDNVLSMNVNLNGSPVRPFLAA